MKKSINDIGRQNQTPDGSLCICQTKLMEMVPLETELGEPNGMLVGSSPTSVVKDAGKLPTLILDTADVRKERGDGSQNWGDLTTCS